MKSGSNAARDFARSVIPRQAAGRKSTIEISHFSTTTVEAEQIYQSLKILLLNVSCWDSLLSPPTAKFCLTDAQGLTINRQARVQDRFRIKIPGPSPTTGRGYDWVRVKQLTEVKKDDAEIFYLTACPAPDPQGDSNTTAHFLTRCASTTFLIIKEDLHVSCVICSRNEVPNSHSGPWQNRVRNNLVGFFAGAILSKWQWRKLAQTLMTEVFKVKNISWGGQVSLITADKSFPIKRKRNVYSFRH